MENSEQARPETSRSKRYIGKSPALGQNGMVCAHNVEGAEVGAAMLRAGGNAYDAIVAMSFVTAVRETAMNSIGGVGVALAYSAADRRVREINFYGRTPSGLAEDTFVPYIDPDAPSAAMGWPGVQNSLNERGYLSVGVPTYIAGLAELHASGATMSWAELLQPAISLAEEGFVPDEGDTAFAATHYEYLTEFEDLGKIILANGIPKPPGFYQGDTGRIVQADLARTLRTIADEGPDAFYTGAIAEQIVSAVQAGGGVLSQSDLADYRPDLAEGFRTTYRGYEVVVSSGVTGGLTLIQMLNMAERFELGGLDRWSGECLHLLAEIMRQAWTDRFVYVGDPSGETVPLDGLMSKDYAADIAPSLPTERAPAVTSPGEPWQWSAREPQPASVGGDPGGRDTTHLVAADGLGNIITLTQTLGLAYGSCVVPPGTGVNLYDITMWMNPLPGTANSVGPSKSQLGHATPVILLKDGEPVAALGAPGARMILTAMFQSIVNMVDFGMNVQEAIGAPRMHIEGADPVAPVGPTVLDLYIDDQTPQSGIDALVERGHRVHPMYETGTQNAFAKPLGIAYGPDGIMGGVDVYRESVAIGV